MPLPVAAVVPMNAKEGETRSYTSAGDISAIGTGVGVLVGTGVGLGAAVGVGVGVLVGTGVGVGVAVDRDVPSEGSDGVLDGVGWLQAARATTTSKPTTDSPKRQVEPTSLSLITSITTILP